MEELYEYKNLGLLKSYVGPFSSSVVDNIEKKLRKKWKCYFRPILTEGKRNLLYASNFGGKTVYHLFGSELFTVTPNLLQKLERCQMWLLTIIFRVPKFVPNLLILQLAGLSSIESETDIKKLLFLGRLLTEPKMTFVVKSLFQSRATLIQILNQYVLYQVFVTPCINTICLPI